MAYNWQKLNFRKNSRIFFSYFLSTRSRGSGFGTRVGSGFIFLPKLTRALNEEGFFKDSVIYFRLLPAGELRPAAGYLFISHWWLFMIQGQIQPPTSAMISGMAPESPLMMNWMAMASTKIARNLAMILSSFSPMNRKRWFE